MNARLRPPLASLIAGALFVALSPNDARGEDAPSAAPLGTSLALELLGANDMKVIRPGSVGTLLSEARALVEDGRLTPGIGFEVSPFGLGIGGALTYEDLVSHPWRYNLSRATMSVGSVADPARPGSVRSAVAVRLRLWDETDWRLSKAAIACHQQVVTPPAPPDAPPTDFVTPAPGLSEQQVEAIGRCLEKSRRWNASQASVGAGLTALSLDGKVSSLGTDAVHLWFGIGFGIGGAFQFLASGRYVYQSQQEAGMPPAVVVPSGHTGSAGASIAYKLSRLVLQGEAAAGWHRQQEDDSLKLAFTGVAQIEVGAGMWFELRYEYSRMNDVGAQSGGGNLRWSYDAAPAK